MHTNTLLLSSVVFLFFTHYFIDCQCPNIISRTEWGAKSPKRTTNLKRNPPPYVVIHHSDTPGCLTTEKCKSRIKNIQHDHMNNRGWSDIGYNFLIGGDGNVYEGRGWGKTGAHVPKYNSKSIGICMIGTFKTQTPPAAQLNALRDIISCAKESNKVVSAFHLIGHRQGGQTDCPGNNLFNEIKQMPNWDANPN